MRTLASGVACGVAAVLAGCGGTCGEPVLAPEHPHRHEKSESPPPANVPMPVTAIPLGMSSGFSGVRVAEAETDLPVARFPEWSHFVELGAPATSPGVLRVQADVLAGPAMDGRAATLTSQLRAGSPPTGNPAISLGGGAVYMHGRWILPTTTRVRGTSGGGLMRAGVPDVVNARVVVLSDATGDVVLFPDGIVGQASTLPVVLRHWDPATCTGPDGGCEQPVVQQVAAGRYMVVTTDPAAGMQRFEVRSWNLAAGEPAHAQRVRDLVQLVNQKLAGMPGYPQLPPLTP